MKITGLKSARWTVFVLIVLMVAYGLVFSLVALLKYQSFSFHDIDLALINQTFWNTAHGNITSHSLGEATILNGGHIFLIIFILTPLYLILPGPLTLLILQTLGLALGAWPIYLIARKLISPAAGLMISVCYLIYPALNYVNLFEFHPISLAVPTLLFMFLFYLKRSWALFLVFMILSLFIREDVTIPVAAFGIFTLLELLFRKELRKRNEIKWSLVPLAAAIAWYLFCTRYLQPHFRPDELNLDQGKGMLSFFAWLQGPPLEMIQNVFLHPQFGILRTLKLRYLWHLFLPLGFFSLLYPPALIMVVISMAEGLLSSRSTHFSIHYQYSSIIIPAIFISAIYGIRKLLAWKLFSGRCGYLLLVVGICSIGAAYSWGPLLKLPEQINSWQVTEEDRVRENLLRQKIPPHDPVIATFGFTPKLSNRARLFYFYHIYSLSRHPQFTPHVKAAQATGEWALIDFDDWLTFYDFYTPGGFKSVFRFLIDGRWELVSTVNSLALFRKGHRANLGVVSLVKGEIKGGLRIIPELPALKLAGVDVGKKRVSGQETLSLQVDLRCEQSLDDNILLSAHLVNSGHPSVVFQQFFFAPYRIYPTSLWQPGKTIRQKCNILIPSGFPAGSYDLVLTLLHKRAGLPLSPEAQKLFYGYYDTAMALKALPGKWDISPDQLLEQIVIARIPQVVNL